MDLYDLAAKVLGDTRMTKLCCVADDLRVFFGGEDWFSMTTLPSKEFGLVGTVYASQIGTDISKAKIIVYPKKASNRGVFFHVSICDNPRVIRKSWKMRFAKIPQNDMDMAIKFVKTNKDLLSKFWGDRDMSSCDFLDAVKPIGSDRGNKPTN